jgi:hypothetical protein
MPVSFASGLSLKNIGSMIGTYGVVWLVWLVVNRVVCDNLEMMVREPPSVGSVTQLVGSA